MAVRTPVSAVHHRSGRREVLSERQLGGGAFGRDQRRHTGSADGSVGTLWIHNRRPDQAADEHRQRQKDAAEHHLPEIVPAAADHGKNQQQHRQRRRESAEETEGLDLEDHQTHQHKAEHGHAERDGEQPPPGATRQITSVLRQPRQQRHQRHHHDCQVSEQPGK